MADLEIGKGGFKVIGAALKAAEGGSHGSGFSRGVWGPGPPGKFFYSEAILKHSEVYFSATDADSRLTTFP